MALFSYIAGIFAAATLFAAPMPAAASVGFMSFGGRVVLESVCLNGAIDVTVKPAGVQFAVPYSYIYLPTTLTLRGPVPTTATPPILGQSVIGTVLPVLIPCIGLGLHPPIYFGYPMLTEAVGNL